MIWVEFKGDRMTTVSMNFNGPVYGVTPNLKGQRIAPINEVKERAAFEEWYTTHAFDYESNPMYTTHAFDYESNPIGSRDCDLQWKAWVARAQQEAISS